jgi:hypothetical protein
LGCYRSELPESKASIARSGVISTDGAAFRRPGVPVIDAIDILLPTSLTYCFVGAFDLSGPAEAAAFAEGMPAGERHDCGLCVRRMCGRLPRFVQARNTADFRPSCWLLSIGYVDRE